MKTKTTSWTKKDYCHDCTQDTRHTDACKCGCHPSAQPSHTPTPWKVNYTENVEGHMILDEPALIGPKDEDILRVSEWSNPSIEDAAFIVRAVNSHEELLATLKGAEKVLRKFLPVLEQHTDDDGQHAGEWLDEIKEVVAKFEAIANCREYISEIRNTKEVA